MRNFDNVDKFFIIIIGVYFCVLFTFILALIIVKIRNHYQKPKVPQNSKKLPKSLPSKPKTQTPSKTRLQKEAKLLEAVKELKIKEEKQTSTQAKTKAKSKTKAKPKKKGKKKKSKKKH